MIDFQRSQFLVISRLLAQSLVRPTPTQEPDYHLIYHLCSRLRSCNPDYIIPFPQVGQFTNLCKTFYSWEVGQPARENAYAHLREMQKIVDEALALPMPTDVSRFSHITDRAFAEILERDLQEAEVSADHGHWKSCIVLCGSILEAALYEYLRRNSAWTMDAAKRNELPKKKGGVVRDIQSNDEDEKWSLAQLVKFVCSNGLLDPKWEDGLSVVLREPRNLIHPAAELRGQGRVDEESARASIAVLIQALKDLYLRPVTWP